MPRLRYLALLLLSILSLLICSATLFLWHRSYRGPDFIHYTSPDQWCLSLISGHGTLDILVIPHWPQEPELRRGRYDRHVYYGTRYSKRVLGFGTDSQWPEYGGRYVNVPHWFVAAAGAGATVIFARAWHRRRPKPPGRCPECGYDLRATPMRCPECGASIVSTPQPGPTPSMP